MRKMIFFLYFIVSISAVSLDELQNLMTNKQYDIHGIFYKYDFANVEPAWDFVYVSNGVYRQLKGVEATSTNVFGWKTIDAITVSSPSFYFVYLGDIDNNNQNKYSWIAVNKTSSTINKLIGSTSSGYFSWSENLSKLSFSFSQDNKKITFSKSIANGASLSDDNIPKFPDIFNLSDVTLEGNDTGGQKDDNKDGDTNTGSKNDDNKTGNSGNDNGGSNETNTSKEDEDAPDCHTYVESYGDSVPAAGVCLESQRKEIK